METRFATYSIQTNIGSRIVPSENCERRVLLVPVLGVGFFVSSAQTTPVAAGVALPGEGQRIGPEPQAIILRANQALYAFAGDAGGTQVGVVISEHPLGCMP